jgi:predicted RNase H-like HicB family nuclease
MSVRDYAIVIFYSDEDACYVADIPDLRYCSAFGDTLEEALAELLDAQQAWLESASKHGDPIPESRYKPMNYQVT